jgi:hypothetical protein
MLLRPVAPSAGLWRRNTSATLRWCNHRESLGAIAEQGLDNRTSPNMNHGINCKFCQKPISIEVDDDYAALGDPNGLLPLACCNPCADIRNDRRRIETAIARVCAAVSSLSRSEEREREIARGALVKLTKAYAEMIARWHHVSGGAWDEEGVSLLMDKPRHWPQIIGIYWQMFREWQHQRETNT